MSALAIRGEVPEMLSKLFLGEPALAEVYFYWPQRVVAAPVVSVAIMLGYSLCRARAREGLCRFREERRAEADIAQDGDKSQSSFG